MEWYHYLSDFGAGLFLSNFVPHFVNGISGNGFPTPFAKPPGKGLSSPVVNVLWSLLNLVVGYLLLRAGNLSCQDTLSLVIFLAGFGLLSVLMAKRFAGKDKA
ncbi:MAG: hypothetical protein P4L51_18685 [Puia sp.]|nr:hypothetical protein [Puia sp.]